MSRKRFRARNRYSCSSKNAASRGRGVGAPGVDDVVLAKGADAEAAADGRAAAADAGAAGRAAGGAATIGAVCATGEVTAAAPACAIAASGSKDATICEVIFIVSLGMGWLGSGSRTALRGSTVSVKENGTCTCGGRTGPAPTPADVVAELQKPVAAIPVGASAGLPAAALKRNLGLAGNAHRGGW